jgi:protein ImuA
VAAEASSAWVALFRPLQAVAESSPACLRLALESDGEGLAVKIFKRRGPPLTRPLRLPVKRPVHALGRTPFPVPAAGSARADRGLGLPVHA